jgi:Sulfotransferase domain
LKPTYVGIGAQKCASTSLHQILAAHPSVCVPLIKEIDFFSLHFDRGHQWYEQQFAACGDAIAMGEMSPSYFCDPLVPARIHAYAPDIRIILSLRDPVQRALSNHRHEVRVGHLQGPDFSFETGLANNPQYIDQGLYATHLKRWLEFFPIEQILVVLMDDIENAPAEVAGRVYRFIGVDPVFQPVNLHTRFNPSYANRSALLRRVKDSLYNYTRAPGLKWLWEVGAATGLKRMYRAINQVASDKFIPPPDPEYLAQLRCRFVPEVMELEKILGRSLESWRT